MLLLRYQNWMLFHGDGLNQNHSMINMLLDQECSLILINKKQYVKKILDVTKLGLAPTPNDVPLFENVDGNS